MPPEGAPFHEPVLLQATLDDWLPEPGGRYVDATLGDGGHTLAALGRLDPSARLLGLDRDPTALARAGERLRGDSRVILKHASFSGLPQLLLDLGWDGAHGILADLGVSSPQLDTPQRGFSYRFDAPLDLRMDPTTGEPAWAWLERTDPKEWLRVFEEFGEVRRASAAANTLARAMPRSPVRTTTELVRALEPALAGPGRNAELSRIFQALRIAVNGELEELESLLDSAPGCLVPGGHLVVLSYHSLEDRFVKHRLRSEGWSLLRRKAVLGSTDPNPRARSARLRAARRN